MKFKFLDRERELKYTFRDLLKLREKYGSSDFDLNDIPGLVAQGLRRDDPEITPERVAEIVDMETFGELCSAVRQATGFGREESPRPTRESLASTGPLPDTTSGSPSENSGS